MFKGSSDKLNYVARTASHATKERASGRIDAIPEWAREPEEYYNSVREQWMSILDQLKKGQQTLQALNEKLRSTLPFNEFEQTRIHKERLSARIVILEQQQVAYRELARAAAENAWQTVFFEIAKRLLAPDDFMVIVKETDEMLGHPQSPIKQGRAPLSPEAKAREAKKDALRHRRKKYYAKHGEDRLVWGDEGPLTQQFQDEAKQR